MSGLNTIVLLGAPGSGKTTTGAELATKLDWVHRDIDELIENKVGRKIADIFATSGEQVFRRLEIETTIEALKDGGVISLGGGAIVSEPIRDALVGHIVIWLKTTLHQAVHRVGNSAKRPLLAGNPTRHLSELMISRNPLYEQCATHSVDTDGLSPSSVAQIIMDLLCTDLVR